MLRFIFFIFKLIYIIALPFVGLIRGAVYFHEVQQLSPALSLTCSIAMTVVLLFLYFIVIYSSFTKKAGSVLSFKLRMWLSISMVGLFCLYGLYYLPKDNSKSIAIQKSFTKLHPILRLSLSTIILIDESLIITDSHRLPEDYRKMGLPSKKFSLHYEQDNGYVHAVDIRTKGQSELRNNLIQAYFKFMGMNTLRHTGTADHLHISLTNIKYPKAI